MPGEHFWGSWGPPISTLMRLCSCQQASFPTHGGARKTITVFFCIAFVGSLLLGMATTTLWAIVGRSLVGIGVAMLFVPTMKVLAEWFRVREFAMMTGILMAMGGIGSLIAATPLAFLSSWIGWRFSFVAVGVFTLLLAVLVWTVVRDRPADLGWPSPAGPKKDEEDPIALWEGVRIVLSSRSFWPLAVWFFFDCAVFFSFGGTLGRAIPHAPIRLKQGPGRAYTVHDRNRHGPGESFAELSVQQRFSWPKARPDCGHRRSPGSYCPTGLHDGQDSTDGSIWARFWYGHLRRCDRGSGIYRSQGVFSGPDCGHGRGPDQPLPLSGRRHFSARLGIYPGEPREEWGTLLLLPGYQQAFLLLFGSAVVAFLSSLCLEESMKKE